MDNETQLQGGWTGERDEQTRALLERAHDPSRVLALSDGVFSIIITLLVLEIHVPELTQGHTLTEALAGVRPSFNAFVVTFILTGLYWVGHRDLFALIRRTDRGRLRPGVASRPGMGPAAYVSHVADNLRIWSERLAGARLAGVTGVPGYDQDLLAQARTTTSSPLPARCGCWAGLLAPGWSRWKPRWPREWCCSTLLAEHCGPRTSRATTRTTPSITCGMSTARRLQAT